MILGPAIVIMLVTNNVNNDDDDLVYCQPYL